MTEENALFEIVPARPRGEPTPRDSVVASGLAWEVVRQTDGLWLFYLSGAQGGGERAILVDETDTEALRSGQRTLNDVLIARGAG